MGFSLAKANCQQKELRLTSELFANRMVELWGVEPQPQGFQPRMCKPASPTPGCYKKIYLNFNTPNFYSIFNIIDLIKSVVKSSSTPRIDL